MNGFKTLKLSSVVVLVAYMGLLMLTACVGNGDEQVRESPSNHTRPNTKNGPLAKYDPPIEVSFVRNLSEVVENNVLSVLEDETFEDNRWTRLYEEELGIRIVYDWVVKGNIGSDIYNQKFNMTVASGELPDVIPVNAVQLKQLAEADMIEDMTEWYEQFATPFTKQVLSHEGSPPFDIATYHGKLMAIPEVHSSIESAMFIWIRTDWLDKLGLSPPKTMTDVRAISKAFTKQDPDGNGVHDTFGLAVKKDLWGGFAGLEGFMAGFQAYPNIWIEDEQGNLVYGSVQPEVREALLVLQEMAQQGEIDLEFGIKDEQKVAEDIAAGKIGMLYGEQWNSIWPLQMNVNRDPDAQWRAFPIVSDLTDRPKVPLRFRTSIFFAVRKGFEHPEAVVKMFNLHLEKNFGETAEFEYYYAPPEAESVWQLSPVQPAPPLKNLIAYREIDAARKANDTSKLTGEAKTIQKKLEAYASGSSEGFALWGWERVYGPEGSMGIMDMYDKNNQFLYEKFVGAPTPTMVNRQSALNMLQNEVFAEIILGHSIEAFDKFVQDWHQLGGHQMTKEVNEWYRSTRSNAPSTGNEPEEK